MRTGKPVCVEAAIRWRHPVRGLLRASSFVDQVSPAGLAPDYMRFVVRTAAQQMARWRAASVPVPRVSVNVWPLSLADEELLTDMLAAVADAGIEPAAMELESSNQGTFSLLDRFRRAGFRVALDDFGGSDIRYEWLRHERFDVVKLPVTFVLRASSVFDDAVIAAGVGFARSIGAETVAEGVETVTIRDRVRDLGCDIGQGFLWSQQVLAEELPAVLQAIGIDGASAKPVA
jgi:EAL domain-containing protein (putative c-di-GMP-specific phosphodiesterase class I)